MIDDITIRRVKDASSIVDVISDFYELKREGTGYTCLCPFHDDRHYGSFKISPKRNIYTCFSCGESGGPVDFIMKHEKLTFIEAIQWLGRKYGIEVEGSERFTPKPCKPHTPPPPLPMLVLPHNMISKRQELEDDTFCKWLRALPWSDQQRARVESMIRNYLIGHSKDGHTIFWQMDERGQLRTGKMMLYKPDGHRDRDSKGNFSWIHSKLAQAKYYDPEQYEVHTTLFGMHLLDYCQQATVNIVESEKTAIICAIAYGDMQHQIWMASGGLTSLTSDKLKPIIQRARHIVLYPDHDGITKWEEAARIIGYKRLRVNSKFVEQYWKPVDGEKADIADILLRMLQEGRGRGPQLVGDIISKHPMLSKLINKFDLTPIRP